MKKLLSGLASVLIAFVLGGCEPEPICLVQGTIRAIRVGSGSMVNPKYTVVRLDDGKIVTVNGLILGAVGDTVMVNVKCKEVS